MESDVEIVMVVMILVLRMRWKNSLNLRYDANLKITINSELVEISDDQELRNLFHILRYSLV